MADLATHADGRFATAGAGPFSRLAREQYAALAAMRGRMFVNSLRSNHGMFEFSARAVANILYSLLGLSLGVAAGAIASVLVLHRSWSLLPIEFWVLCFLWQAVSLALASFQEQYDIGHLLRFPVNFSSFFGLYLLFGLVDASTLLGGLCSIGILLGITLVRTDLFGCALVGVAGFAAFNILLVRAVLVWLDRWLARRRSREIVGVFFLFGLLCLQFLNPTLRDGGGEDFLRNGEQKTSRVTSFAKPLVQGIETVQAWLPPGLLAVALQNEDARNSVGAVGSLALLSFFVVGTGGLLGIRLHAEYRGENLGEAPRRATTRSLDRGWRTGDGPVSAVVEKELRTMFRSIPQVYSVLVPTLMVFVIGGLFRHTEHSSRHTYQLALPVCVAYGLLGFTQLMYNNLGTEGKGIQMLFMAPTPLRTVMLAKNLFHSILFGIVALSSAALACLRIGVPSAEVLATTVAWIAFALPANLMAGNLLSLTMAYRINLGKIGRQSGSQANALLSMLIQTTLLGIGSGVISLCAASGRLWVATPILLCMAVAAVFGWTQVLRQADAMANERRDVLIAKLAKTE